MSTGRKNGSAPVLAETESPEAEKTARNGTDVQFSGPRSERASATAESEKLFMILRLKRANARYDTGLQVAPKARFEKGTGGALLAEIEVSGIENACTRRWVLSLPKPYGTN